jgi:hypothetical protein
MNYLGFLLYLCTLTVFLLRGEKYEVQYSVVGVDYTFSRVVDRVPHGRKNYKDTKTLNVVFTGVS